MTNLNEKKARLAELESLIRAASFDIETCVMDSHHTKDYLYAGFHFGEMAASVVFCRNGVRLAAVMTGPDTFEITAERGALCAVPSYKQLPQTVRGIIGQMFDAARRLKELHAEYDALLVEVKANESYDEELPPPPATISICGVDVATELPQTAEDRAISENIAAASKVEDVEAYSYAAALRSTLAERVEARERVLTAEPDILEDGTGRFVGDEAGAFADALNVLGVDYIEGAEGTTPAVYVENFAAVMAAVDKDIIDDINEALEEIDASNVNALLEHANACEALSRLAKGRCYREVAQLAATYAINDAIESQPELEDLLSALFDWSTPAQLPENIAAGVADALASAREVFSVSLLSPNDLGEETRLCAMDGWSMDTELFRAMDSDSVRAFSFHVNCGVWLSYFNQVWVFEVDHVTEAVSGSFESQIFPFTSTLGRFLGPDAEDLY